MTKQLLFLFFVAVGYVAASPAGQPGLLSRADTPNYPSIASRVEKGIQTECKTCPYSLCTNKIAYEYETNVTLTCWTEGTNVNNDTTWLGTTDGYYVTQWDLIEWPGDYTEDLPYCGHVREEYTETDASPKYFAECNIYPSLTGDHIKMYKHDIDLTLTCKYETEPDTGTAITDGTWYKTTSNCYVTQNLLHRVWGKNDLDDCGPVPFMELKMREPDPEPEAETEKLSFAPPASEAKRSSLAPRFLYETYVGYDYAPCRTKPDNSSHIIKTFQWNDTVTPQCGTYGGTENTSRSIYLLTIDWCYVEDSLMDPELIDSVLRSENFPHCEYFVDEE